MSEDISHSHKQKLLFVVNEAGEFVELRRVALAAKSRGYEIHFLFVQPGYINLRRDRAFCRLNGFKDYFPGKKLNLSLRVQAYRKKAELLEDGYLPHSLQDRRKVSSGVVRVAALGISLLLYYPYAIADRFRRLWGRAKEYSDANKVKPFRYSKLLFLRLQPDIIVFGQEFPGSVNTLLTKLANRDGVSTLIVPFAVGTTKEMVESLVDKADYEVDQNLLNRMAAFLFPHWVNYYSGKRLLRLPGKTVMLLEALGLAPEHPWLPNNSHVTRIAVESREMECYYRKMRFPEEQLRLTGSAYDDVLVYKKASSQECKKALFRRLSAEHHEIETGGMQHQHDVNKSRLWDSDKPLLVCAWPTDQYGSRYIPMEFGSYELLCNAWAKALSLIVRLTDFNVIIRPHPVTDPAFLATILQPHGLHDRVTDIDTLELVPVCDLFVACVSSTLRWAIACGIPAVNYDCYDYGYTDFDSAKGVSTVKKYVDFELVLQRLTEDAGAYAEAKRNQEECASELGLHDGRSTERILNLIQELTQCNSV